MTDWDWCVNRIREIQTRVLALEAARPMKRKKTYDRRCLELAAIFLSDEPQLNTPGNVDQLAVLIQRTIEDFIAFMRPDEAAQ